MPSDEWKPEWEQQPNPRHWGIAIGLLFAPLLLGLLVWCVL